MNINALLAFDAVVTEGSAAAAAKRVNRSQSAVSRLIALLEHEVRLQLFYRTRQRLLLTADGQAFYRETQAILSGLKEIPHRAADIREKQITDVRVVSTPRASAAWIAPATARFVRNHPKCRMHIDVLRRYEMENGLARRYYDLGVAVLPASHPSIESSELFRAPLCAAVGRGHPLARRSIASVTELARYPVIGMSPGLIPREQMDRIFTDAALSPKYGIRTSATHLACQLAAASGGIAIIDTVSAAASDGKLVCIPLEPAEWVSFGVLAPKDPIENRVARLYMEELGASAERLVKTHRIELRGQASS